MAVGEGHPVQLPITLDGNLKERRQGVDHRDTYPMQATGKVVVTLGEFTAGVEASQNQLHTRNPMFLVHVDRHPAAVVFHAQGTIAVQDDIDPAGVPRQGFVDTVINDFLGQMVGPTGIGVHAWAFADRVQTTQNFNGIGVVLFLAHGKEATPRVCYKTGP